VRSPAASRVRDVMIVRTLSFTAASRLPWCRTRTSLYLSPPPMKLITSPEVTIPRIFLVPASVTGSRRKPHSVIVATALMMLCVGGTETTSRVAIRHQLAFLLYDMGLELDRSAVELAPHFYEPVTGAGGPPVAVHVYLPPILEVRAFCQPCPDRAGQQARHRIRSLVFWLMRARQEHRAGRGSRPAVSPSRTGSRLTSLSTMSRAASASGRPHETVTTSFVITVPDRFCTAPRDCRPHRAGPDQVAAGDEAHEPFLLHYRERTVPAFNDLPVYLGERVLRADRSLPSLSSWPPRCRQARFSI